MNIFNWFRKNGVDTIDPSFYRKIEEWKSWYNSNVRGFSFYRVYTGQGTYKKKRRKSLGMAKTMAEDIANLLINERVAICTEEQSTQDFVDKVLKKNRFQFMANHYQELKAATGTVAYVPALKDVIVDDNGAILSGKIGIDYVSAENIFPVSWENGKVTECIFGFPKMCGRKKYIHLQHHKIDDDGLYVIENTVLEARSGSEDGIELTQEEWHQLKPFRNLAPRFETGSDKPQFVVDTLNLVNNADLEESNPMGIAIFANALDVLATIDIIYDSFGNEYDLGRKRVFVAPEMLKNIDGSPAFDTDDTVFYKMPDGYSGEEGLIHELDMNIRAADHEKGINDNLNYLSVKCGFGTERYRFDKGGVKTATEVISVNSDMYRTLVKHENVLNDVLVELVRIIIRLGNVLGYNLDEEQEIKINFDDSIIEDSASERKQDMADISIGAMQLYEYRMKWYGEDEATAKAMVMNQSEKDVIE